MLYLLIEGVDTPTKVRVTEDEMIYAVDLVMAITRKNRNEGGLILRNLDPADFPAHYFKTISTPGKGGYQTKVVSFKHAIQLAMVLPGKQAKNSRLQWWMFSLGIWKGMSHCIKRLKGTRIKGY